MTDEQTKPAQVSQVERRVRPLDPEGDPVDYAGWLADKLHNTNDYGKEAAAALMSQANRIEYLSALEYRLDTLKQIADIAHCGGIAGLTEAEALTSIRRLTLKHWDKGRNTDTMAFDTRAAVKASKSARA